MLSSGVSSSEKSYGFENLARFGPQATGARVDWRDRKSSAQGDGLSAEEQQQVDRLRQTDRKVRAHEQAHVSVGAELIRGGASFTYEYGPDRQRYAVAGEVSIDTSPGRTPEETIPKAQHIKATALAPADPSPQDYRVASLAGRMESDARLELVAQQSAESGAQAAGSQEKIALYRQVEAAGTAAISSRSPERSEANRLDLFA